MSANKMKSVAPSDLELKVEAPSAMDRNKTGTAIKSGSSDNKVGVVQDMLDSLKTTLDLPVQFKPKS